MYKKEILRDTSKNSGRVRPWQEKKLANLTYSEYLEVLKFKKANNVSKCGEVLQFAKTADGLKLYQTWFCHSRLCPLCSWRRSLKNSYELRQILGTAYKKEPSAIFLFLTLTEESSKLGELRKNLTSMNRSIYRLFKYKDVKKDLLGYVRSTEITVNRDNLTFHQHVHILLMMKSGYFSKGHYLTQEKWSQLWQRARKLDYKPIVNIKKIRASKKDNSLIASAKEVSKYQVKDYDYITDDEKGDLVVVDELEHALAGTRQLSFAGILKEIRHDLLLDEKEDDLINADNSKVKDDIVGTVMYRWNNKVSNYVRWE
ncbi:protein rep [Limosilactobacillus reuteri]|uniref:protein rep n=1 Tax=Limosilactobacillus reuteri TaxID=1598 RepID=UPI002B054424|nr:protein rep [Limosilactobacillus reuteri]